MSTDLSFYRHLLQRFLHDELSRAEAVILLDYIATHPDEVDQLLGEKDRRLFEQQLAAKQDLPNEQSARMRERLLTVIRQHPPARADNLSRSDGRQLRMRLGWAAAIVLCVGAAWYGIATKRPATLAVHQPTGVVSPAMDVQPGTNAAVLTLGNGKKVILDSTAAGMIAQQGNAKLINRNGRLTYAEEVIKEGPAAGAEYNTLTTQKSNQYKLVLSDGTQVWLDASSSITYPTVFAGHERRIRVTGQAYMEVAPNPHSPFLVEVNGRTVVDLGTAFNINAYPDEAALTVTLASGAIRMVDGTEQTTLSKPGQQVASAGGAGRVGGASSKLEVREDADLESVLAWKNGFFSFDGADIHTVMRQISRWYGVDVRYEGKPTTVLFGGEIGRNLNLSQVLDGLQKTDVHFKLEGKMLTVLP
jgi:transmembrane sensor